MRRILVLGATLATTLTLAGATALAQEPPPLPPPLTPPAADAAQLPPVAAGDPAQPPPPVVVDAAQPPPPPTSGNPMEAEVTVRINAAMEAYETALDVEAAGRLLEEAVTIVKQNQLAGPTAASALALSAVTLLWLGQQEPAIERFRMALACNPAVQIPPSWSGPDVDAVLAAARQQGPLLPPPPPPPEALRHAPVTQQMWNHPVPISVETNPNMPIVGATLYFRSRGETGWQLVQMSPIPGGFWGEIPCSMIQPQTWEYAVNVVDAAGTVLGVAGTPDAPHEILMLPSIGGALPLRPDGTEAPACLPDGRSAESGGECPPGMTCEPGGSVCRSCAFDDDCLPGEICSLGCCGPRPPDPGDTGMLGLFLDVGVGLSFGIIGKTAKEPLWYTDPFTGESMYGPDDERDGTDVGPGIALGGGAVRLGFGWFVIPELSIALNFRMGFPFDLDYSGFPWLVEARGAWWFRLEDTHLLGVFIDGGAGVMVHMVSRVAFNQGRTFDGGEPCGGSSPIRECKVYEPFYKASGYGTAGLGLQYYWMMYDWLGLGGELAMNAMFPEFSWNFDVLFNTRFAF